ncbi:MAG: hypothetical protein OEM02_03025 [Desulfobulbaceae bacterium]|nr:hypothetical protein [Desulfobulbaceae bacterium]
MDQEKLIQKQNKLLARESYYRRVRLISAISGLFLFMASGIGFSRGEHLLAVSLLLTTIIALAMVADSHVKLFQIGSIQDHRTEEKHNQTMSREK